ncbi:effector-associated constant component EACC1 [Kitasatospora sp. P5_F3]
MQMAVGIAGTDRSGAEVASLKRALLSDPDLRSVQIDELAGGEVPGAMGVLSEGLLLAFGAGGVGVTVVQALCGWLAGRRPGVRLKITHGDRTVEIDVTRARSAEEVLALYRQLETPPGNVPDRGAGA